MYCVVDIETSGGKFNEEGITEIAIYKYNGSEIIDQLISLVNPEKPIQPFVVKLTGINDRMVATAPKFHEIAKRIIEITEDAVLVAHNAQFDYRILKNCFQQLGYDFNRKTICTVELSKKLIPDEESYSLGKLTKSLGIPLKKHHRAEADAYATLKLLQVLLDKDLETGLFKSAVKSNDKGLLNPKLQDTLESIPYCEGLVKFYDKEEQLIFVLKDKDIHKKTTQLFFSESKRHKQLCKQFRSIEVVDYPSKLIIELIYHQLLIQSKPKFNKRRKKPNKALVFDLIKEKNVVILDCGRVHGEKSFIYLEAGYLKGYGFGNLNIQHSKQSIVKRLISPLMADETSHEIITRYTDRYQYQVLELKD